MTEIVLPLITVIATVAVLIWDIKLHEYGLSLLWGFVAIINVIQTIISIRQYRKEKS